MHQSKYNLPHKLAVAEKNLQLTKEKIKNLRRRLANLEGKLPDYEYAVKELQARIDFMSSGKLT